MSSELSRTKDKIVKTKSGWAMMPLFILGILVPTVSMITAMIRLEGFVESYWWLIPLDVIWCITMIICLTGLFTVEPNSSRVMTLFGAYVGTEKDAGFHWANPFNLKRRVSLRSNNLNGEKLKVNDLNGNPIEIAAVVVWRVKDTAQASFDVENYEEYVRVQSESAVRYLASAYSYDGGEEHQITLRSGGGEVNTKLVEQLTERFEKAGVEVQEARITHLAYAPEIAQAMLKRQQAEAIIAARKKIVHGAVSMVEMALNQLSSDDIIELDEERKASMISNLLVVLCSDSDVNPVINTGTLYN